MGGFLRRRPDRRAAIRGRLRQRQSRTGELAGRTARARAPQSGQSRRRQARARRSARGAACRRQARRRGHARRQARQPEPARDGSARNRLLHGRHGRGRSHRRRSAQRQSCGRRSVRRQAQWGGSARGQFRGSEPGECHPHGRADRGRKIRSRHHAGRQTGGIRSTIRQDEKEGTMRKDKDRSSKERQFEQTAGNGILNRRVFLERALKTGAMGAAGAGTGATAASAEPLAVPRWMKEPGVHFSAYGQPSRFEAKVVRTILAAPNPATQGIGTARTPLRLLNGMITPNGLHFERSHSGAPDIDPDQHRLLIHGLVKRPLLFTTEALSRYPMESRIAFVECAGNSAALNAPQAQPLNVQAIHGLLSCAEWTGVRLATLLDEAGVEPEARWVIAEGADAAPLSRSIPLAKAMDDALVCLYQNGERVRPSNGYPVRLLLPGFEGNMNVKLLLLLQLTADPAMTKDETSKYTILLKDGKAWQFVFPIEVKSFITHPSPG